MTRSSKGAAQAVKGALIGGSIASLTSAAVLMQRGLAETYVGFGAGLALAGLLAQRRR